MEQRFDDELEYELFLDYIQNELIDKNSNLCISIGEDLKSIRGNYTRENKRKISSMIFMLREIELMQLPIFSEWYKHFK
jgi:hypothetical protein